MRQQIPNDNKMFIYIHDGPMTIMKRTGGAVFCDTTSGYGTQRDGASCFDTGASEPTFKENNLICAQQPSFSFFLWPFSYKITFPFLDTTLACLPFLVGFFYPTHTHTLNRLQNKVGIKPTPGSPPGHDVTKLQPARLPARLPFLVGFFHPTHTHTLNQLQNKVGTKPTPGSPPEHDVTKLHLHMTSHPLLHTHV